MDSAELKRLAAASVLLPEDGVRKEGQPKWVRASAINGLFPKSGLRAVAPPPSTPVMVLAVAASAPTGKPALTGAMKANPTLMRRKATFLEWYGVTLGRQWWIVQGTLWVLYGFLWIPIWWLATRHKLDPEQLSLTTTKVTTEEACRQQELEKLERLQGNGVPFIQGEIVRLRGVSGLAKGECGIRFQKEGVVLELATGKRVGIRYDQIKGLQIAGKGKVVESVDNAFVVGGFGLGGALQGAAQAMLLNVAEVSLTGLSFLRCGIPRGCLVIV